MVTCKIRHWLPILTFCPENNLPDLIYITVEFNKFAELYAVRKKVRKLISKKKMYMEDIAKAVSDEFNTATCVTVRLVFNRHVVTHTLGEINAHN